MSEAREAELRRETKETTVDARRSSSTARGTTTISTGIPFFDHMLEQLGKHAGFDLDDRGEGRPRRRPAPHGGRRRASCSATRCARRSATSAACAGSRTRSCRSTRRSCRSRSTSRAARSSCTTVDPVAEWIGTFDPQLAEEFWKGFVDGARVTLHMRSVTRQERPPRDRGVVQGRRARAARRGEGRGRRRAVDQGNVVELTMTIAVVDYGIGNLRSAEKALQHLGADARLTADAARRSRRADAVVLPGVGAFGACMQRAARERSRSRRRVAAATDGRPFLGICIGMQMLFDGSDESPDVAGLGVVAGPGHAAARRRCGSRRWAGTRSSARAGLALLGAACPIPRGCYFVHSYAPEPDDDARRRRVVRLRPPVRGRGRARARCGPRSSTPRRAGAVGLRAARATSWRRSRPGAR